MKNRITGSDLRLMLLNAATMVENNKQLLNELNVFPVPDGDTGTNMTMTLNAAVPFLTEDNFLNVGSMADLIQGKLLRGARGNSGVILSLLFQGLAKRLLGSEDADSILFASAMTNGVDTAYNAVLRPSEGTILTVSKMAAAAATAEAVVDEDIIVMMEKALAAAEEALAKTTYQNPVLEKAGVIDAGGKGWTLCLAGFLSALKGEALSVTAAVSESKTEENVFSVYNTEDIKYAYCTEYLVKRAPGAKDPLLLRAYLETIGDSVMVVDDDEIIKVHVHTNNPGLALEEGAKSGMLSNMKIENMKEQHSEKLFKDVQPISNAKPPEEELAPAIKKYGFVAVASGSGIISVFRDLGVDSIVEGGQTMNPSTEDILKAVNATASEIVIVLPNNKNILMAAQQVIPLTKKQVLVLPTKTVPHGVAAMLEFDPDESPENNLKAMNDAAARIRTGSVTFAVRDSVFDGLQIKEGDYLALSEGKMCYTGNKLDDAVRSIADYALKDGADFITVFSGKDAKEEQTAVVASVFGELAPNAELNMLNGEQPIYYYIISVE